jgi:hypothetical protein
MTAPTTSSSTGNSGVLAEDGVADSLPNKPNQRPPMRIDPDGVVNLGRDGVLRSLNADHTVVLDYRRLSPEEIKDFAAPADQATRDALTGVDGRDVIDVEQLWTSPIVKSVVDESVSYKDAA